LAGGTGNDILDGVAGNDSFIWLAALDGTGNEFVPNTDTVKNFSNGDVLDISDLLGDTAENSANLVNFLEVSFGSGDTTIKIDKDGGGDNFAAPHQTIIVEGADLTGGNVSQAAIIDNLLSNGFINTDGV